MQSRAARGDLISHSRTHIHALRHTPTRMARMVPPAYHIENAKDITNDRTRLRASQTSLSSCPPPHSASFLSRIPNPHHHPQQASCPSYISLGLHTISTSTIAIHAP
ncbi:hypothetical protein K438DRAFT_1969520 [Mycena galopus ATCC 62051]|nr:hypothetical protein K438DRAFT_1969520 [Mycena galopus ATCC 62051]